MSRKKWLHVLRKKLSFQGSSKTITVKAKCDEEGCNDLPLPLSREDVAAIRIQAMFRAHLARQAFRALRSLVKLQALVRGVSVRKQSRIALHCMHALVRLQVRLRARQLLANTNTNALPHH